MNRPTLCWLCEKPWSSTSSCHIAVAVRPFETHRSISSRYGSLALADGLNPGTGSDSEWVITPMAAFESAAESVITAMAAFGSTGPLRPRERTSTPAFFR